MENVRESHATHESNFTGIYGFSVHTIPDSWRIQKFPFWRADSKSCGFVCRIHRIPVDDSKPKPERKNSGLKNIRIRMDGAWITHKPHSNPFEDGLILDTSTFESVVFRMVYLGLLVCLLNYKSLLCWLTWWQVLKYTIVWNTNVLAIEGSIAREALRMEVNIVRWSGRK